MAPHLGAICLDSVGNPSSVLYLDLHARTCHTAFGGLAVVLSALALPTHGVSLLHQYLAQALKCGELSVKSDG